MGPAVLFVVGALALFGSPGPAIVSLAATGAAFGARASLPYLFGIIAGTLVDAGLVVTGLWGLMLVVPFLKPVLLGLAALYIVYLAYRIATAPPLASARKAGAAPKWYEGVFLALANPKAYAAIAALFASTLLVPGNANLDALAKIGLLGLVLMFTDTVWLVAGGLLGNHLSNPRISRPFNILMAALLLVSVGWALFTANGASVPA